MSRAGTGMKVASALLLLGVVWPEFLSGATAQTCTSGSKAVAIFAGLTHSYALLVSKPTIGFNAATCLQRNYSKKLENMLPNTL